VDGTAVWTASPAASGPRPTAGSITERNGYVYLHGLTGAHVITVR
jgi:hypothetical protein